MLVHKTHYMILRSMNTELPCSHSNNTIITLTTQDPSDDT